MFLSLIAALHGWQSAPITTEFDTRNEAATVALSTVYKDLPAYESGGVILKNKAGKFIISQASTDYAGDHVGIDEDPESYPGMEIVATYHVHPCLPKSHYVGKFSPADLAGARMTNHAAYMGDLCTGDVHLWEPGVDGYDSPSVNLPPDVPSFFIKLAGPRLSTGRIVGHFQVTGQSQEPTA